MTSSQKKSHEAPAAGFKISEEASAQAPFLYIDGAPSFGYIDGVVKVTLIAARVIPTAGRHPSGDFAIVGHLRMGVGAARALRDAIDSALQMAEHPLPQNGKPN